MNTLKILLENIQNKGGSAFKSVPYAPHVVDKYVNAYLQQIQELTKKMKPNSKRDRIKRSVCGKLRLINFLYSNNHPLIYFLL